MRLRDGGWPMNCGFNVAALRGARKYAGLPNKHRPAILASMWPRSEERGNSDRDRALKVLARASMWPRSEERGNVAIPKRGKDGIPASMWPRSEERGNTPMRRHQCRRGGLASMWPRSEERGNLPLSPSKQVPRFASMWPRSEERGNSRAAMFFACAVWLQCGRAPRSAEIFQATKALRHHQISFNVAALRGARKLIPSRCASARIASFNVAALRGARK